MGALVHSARQAVPIGLAYMLAVLSLVSCEPSPTVNRDRQMISRCEDFLKTKLVAPSSYKQVSVTVGIPDEKKHRQSVFISYDSVNSYNAPIRGLERCDFPYGQEEARIRPLTDIERRVVAETDAQYPDLEGDQEPACCMPAQAASPVPPAPNAHPRIAMPKRKSVSSAPEPEASISPEEGADRAASLCWQDYCPCDPPQGGPDKGLCRQLRAGIAVDPEIMASAAMMRDARQQLDDFERENPDF